ncbi:hypothetical protein H2199_005687 [Coniosporium tulheliwenetii]|uniref:Uncharacterized protein n=1 Tax=Coniosporium tulheliwenetii TaxID=3383036 RepID=A0ACC2Z0S2_9PEZI|nr:hypothetical protein H2199_005687 [Cladosporium sp. JES 115]
MSEDELQTAGMPPTSRSPRKHINSEPLPTDSMVTVSLSDADQAAESEEESTVNYNLEEEAVSSRPSSLDVMRGTDSISPSRITSVANDIRPTTAVDTDDLARDLREAEGVPAPSGDRSRSDSSASEDSAGVDWERLQKTEQQVPLDDISDESMALLLARLEQENNALATDPKSGLKTRARGQSRPPSIQQLKKLVQGPSSRFSQLPAPPMTELEFWAALVRDYPQTAQRLPTLTANKIRGGIPAPLRGVTWVSLAQARNKLIESQYDSLCGEPSPYENIIGKDLGRTFPGVEMFREREGQEMLGRVLKCFSLYDQKIGYCQGLGFLVGPLLMQMGDKEAFCVLVRLMEDYDLRSCFLPDLSGLHLRIYQFQHLLHQHLPDLATHLDGLQVEAAYLSQWFLSLFACTCPLPMLFRIYDVLFAEGASETIMRVALSIMRRNEKKILAFTEFEDAMQLLLSRALWDPYGCHATSADELVNDFTGLTSLVTREALQSLEVSFREAQNGDNGSNVGFLPGVQTAANRLLGRLWTPSIASAKSASLSPYGATPSRPLSLLQRTASKQSLASMNSAEVNGSESATSHASTAITEVSDLSRDSTADSVSVKSHSESMRPSIRHTASSHDRDLHGQVEDLLTALSNVQQEHALLAAQLQKEREERNEDHRVVRSVVGRLKEGQRAMPTPREMRRRTTPIGENFSIAPAVISSIIPSVLCSLDNRFPQTRHSRMSSAFETKATLRDALARTKDQLHDEAARSASLSRQLSDQVVEANTARDQLKDTRRQLRESHTERQRLEKTIQELRRDALRPTGPRSGSTSDLSSPTGSDTTEATNPATTTATTPSTTGLREFKLSRSASTRSSQVAFSKRSSSLATQAVLSTENHAPASEDALLLELVNAKTSEAVARQELEEMRAKFDSMKKMLGVSTPSPGVVKLGHKISPSEGGKSYMSLSLPTPPAERGAQAKTPASGGGGWFWGKRSVSAAPNVGAG